VEQGYAANALFRDGSVRAIEPRLFPDGDRRTVAGLEWLAPFF
jgi:hypothetical protein